MKEFLFQIKANELYTLPKWRPHEISNRLYWGLGVVPKNNDDIYVSISLDKYIINFYLFSVLCQRGYCCWKYRKWRSHLKNRHHCAKVVENGRINFSISSYCTLLFSRKENFKLLEAALSEVLCNGAIGCIMNVWVYQHWNTANTTLDIYLFFKKRL